MTWKRQRTTARIDVTANVDLDDFSEQQLLQALIDAKWISEEEAEAIEKRSASKSPVSIFVSSYDDELSEARSNLRRGHRSEALIHLERYLGRDWIGVLQ
ncbi:hypothetical protein DTW90_36125 [Neorhizobium sp. P12A]|uniref:hypothetical protein n=1 Tax=Neorhizobium sp. P12A TaxID=2268027 RepID=UPI0011EFC5DF|nr:hypothetical protein [Neorhizobium sp. P12A]KAA0684569.1 hypothetical protein DTW90_36125 [Neorhizobium sp. P12A]